ncbi:medium-chain acyl-CoA ligase ACSF2, mitochondrial-like isoform X2 [Antedon mediterranea]
MEWPLLIAATRAIGVIMIRMQTGYTIQIMKKTMIKTSCKALFLMRSPEDLYTKACTIIPELEKSEHGKIQSDEVARVQFVVAVGANNKRGTINLEHLVEVGNEERFMTAFKQARKLVSNDDISHTGFTSGSTGEPKLVPYTHFASLNSSYFSLDYLLKVKERNTRRMICGANMAYIGGEFTGVAAPLVFGMTTVFPSPTYNFEKMLQATQDEKCTDITMLLFGLFDLVNSSVSDKYDLSSLKNGLTGGSLVPLHLLQEIDKKYGIRILNAYGMSETGLAMSQLPSDSFEYSATTVGTIVPHAELKIVNKNGITVEVGEEGELWVRSPFACRRYYLNDVATQEAFTDGGWFKTGDVGILNKDGYLIIKGRIKNIINKFSRTIHPIEVENVLAKNPAVQKVQVVGVPDTRAGEEVCACIMLKENCTLTLEEVQSYCVEKVNANSMPGHIVIFDQFPLTTSGKFARAQIKKIAEERLQKK